MVKKQNKPQPRIPLSIPASTYDPQLISRLLKGKDTTLFKRKKIFVDSNFFIALGNPIDSLYVKAISIAQKIEEENAVLVLSSFIFLESVTVLSQRAGKEIALRAGRKLLMEDSFEHIHITELLQQRSWEIFREIHKKNMSFIDCSILAVMEYEDIRYLLTFDQKDFAPLRKKYHFEFYN